MPLPRRAALLIAWTGAALFAASIVWFFYLYLVRFGRPAPDGPIGGPVLVNLGLFTAFALHHSAFARTRAKDAVRRSIPAELERSLYTWVASLLFIAVCTWWQPVPGVIYEVHGIWRLLAWSAQAAGIVLTVRASRALDVLDLAGVRAVLIAERPGAPAQRPPLMTHGLYGLVRHPLYSAWALFVFATPAMTGTRAAFAVISTAYLMMAIPWEERALVDTFGEEYRAYRRRVRWRMFPGY
jgi:methanethiol S-methyltransferase